MLDHIFKQDRFKRVLLMFNNPGAADFFSSLQEWRTKQELELRRESDPIKIYRAQGRLEVINLLFALPDELRVYAHKVALGEITPKEDKEFMNHVLAKKG
jgi:hypothetical protein